LSALASLRRLRLRRALLIALSLAGALGLSLVVLVGFARCALIALRLARGVLLHRLLLALLRLSAALARAALRRLALLSSRAALRALTLRTRGCAGLSAALHALGGRQAYSRQ
jgi:hypothetical protein